jgi:hypothetical protein
VFTKKKKKEKEKKKDCWDCTASRISSRLRDFFKAEFQSGLPRRDAFRMKYINLNPRITASRIGTGAGRVEEGKDSRGHSAAGIHFSRAILSDGGCFSPAARINSPKTMMASVPIGHLRFFLSVPFITARQRSGSAGKNVRRRARSSTLYFHVMIAEILDRSLA